MNNKADGFGLIRFLLNLILIGIIAIYGVSIGMGYLNKNLIEKSVTNTLIEFKSVDNADSHMIEKSILNKLEINNIDVVGEDIIIRKHNGGFSVELIYQKKIEINDNISINMNFIIEQETP